MHRVLIISASTGGGHNSTARAIAIGFEQLGCEAKILDGIKSVSSLLNKVISDGYETSAKYTPNLYGQLYKLIDAPYLNKEHEYLMNTLLKSKMQQIIEEEQPDLIICVHPISLMVAAKLKEEGKTQAALMAVLTDYTSHASWVKDGTDAYIVGADELRYLVEEEGANQEKVYPYGIPVNPDFVKPGDLDEVRQKLNLDRDKFTILLMGGSFGVGDLKDFLLELVQLKGQYQIVSVTGRNKSLKEKLDLLVAENHLQDKVRVLGFTRQVSELMSISDLIVTKPGGLTTTEALLKQIPIVIPFFIPGQEEENVDFLLNHGLAVKINRKYSLQIQVQSLMDNPQRLMEIRQRMAKYAKPNSVPDLVDLGMDLMDQKGHTSVAKNKMVI